MAANALVEPLTQAPDRPNVELFAKLGVATVSPTSPALAYPIRKQAKRRG
jgi:hypothetical protein